MPRRPLADRGSYASVAALLVSILLGTSGSSAESSHSRVASITQVPVGKHLDAVAAAALSKAGAIGENRNRPASAGSNKGLYFTEIAASAGLTFRYTFGDYAYDNILESSGSGVTWLDHDLDGDLDLYLLNGVFIEGISDPKGRQILASASNHLYCNDGGGPNPELLSCAAALLVFPELVARAS